MRLMSGELARRSGVNVETLRYYERKGLLPAPPRRSSGYREYREESVPPIRFIKRAQELGFTLGEIRKLLSLRVHPGTTPAEVRRRAGEKLAEIRRKIEDLRAIERALGRLMAACPGEGSLCECPILHHLEGEY
jgi:Hg(II)-responsive transcriptional regulator